jgi:hypothetical protein
MEIATLLLEGEVVEKKGAMVDGYTLFANTLTDLSIRSTVVSNWLYPSMLETGVHDVDLGMSAAMMDASCSQRFSARQ